METFLPNQGTKFDDVSETLPPASKEQLNSLAMRQELNQRTGVAIFVGSQEQRTEMRKVVKHWYRKYELHHIPDVFLDPQIKPGKLEVRYP